ncbi:unnamed protein product, partial [Meganyctiphanes norvegica]
VQFCCYLHSTMRLLVVSVLVLLACAACVSAQAGAPVIKRISILDLLNENPELKESLAKEIRAEKSAPPPATTKPKKTSTTPRTTTTTTARSDRVAQADAPAEPVESTTPQ